MGDVGIIRFDMNNFTITPTQPTTQTINKLRTTQLAEFASAFLPYPDREQIRAALRTQAEMIQDLKGINDRQGLRIRNVRIIILLDDLVLMHLIAGHHC